MMTDEHLVKFGKAARSLRNSENPAFRVQWEQARADGGEASDARELKFGPTSIHLRSGNSGGFSV